MIAVSISYEDLDYTDYLLKSWIFGRFFVHIGLEYLFTLWICFMLYKEYANVASMRLRYLASQRRRVDQFTVSYSCGFSLHFVFSIYYSLNLHLNWNTTFCRLWFAMCLILLGSHFRAVWTNFFKLIIQNTIFVTRWWFSTFPFDQIRVDNFP